MTTLVSSSTSGAGSSANPVVGLIMGSSSDWPIMQHAADILDHFHIAYESRVVSAHRMPLDMVDYCATAATRGLLGIIAGAGGAAHLPGMVAALTALPVYGVPVPSRYLQGQDSLLSIVQMPKGVPVATFSIGEAGAANAALHFIACLATTNLSIRNKLHDYRVAQTEAARAMVVPLD